MANIIFAEQENARLHVPSLKMRQRLQSEPEKLKTPSTAKKFVTPQQSGRKAFGIVNKIVSTPAMKVQEKKLLKSEGTKVQPQKKVQEYPEIEKFIPYDPLDFQKYSVPEDLILLSNLALPGLACFPQASHLHLEEPEILSPLPNMSPVKMPKCSDHCSHLDAFLQTLHELTVELPPESVTD